MYTLVQTNTKLKALVATDAAMQISLTLTVLVQHRRYLWSNHIAKDHQHFGRQKSYDFDFRSGRAAVGECDRDDSSEVRL